MRFPDKVGTILMRAVTQGKTEVPNNEAIKMAEIKVTSLNSKNRFSELLLVRIACGHAWKQNSQDYFLRSVGATNPKIIKLVLINTCHVQAPWYFNI